MLRHNVDTKNLQHRVDLPEIQELLLEESEHEKARGLLHLLANLESVTKAL